MSSAEEVNLNENYHEKYVPVITRKETARVYIKDILYIETDLRIINIYTSSRPYRFYGKLDDVMRYLDGSFYRCHKSCIVNLEKILRMEAGVFYFINETTLRVGQNSYRQTRNHYIKFLEQDAVAVADS